MSEGRNSNPHALAADIVIAALENGQLRTIEAEESADKTNQESARRLGEAFRTVLNHVKG